MGRTHWVRAAYMTIVTAGVVNLAQAGPPLLCPPTTLSPAERSELDRLCDKAVPAESAARELVALLLERTSGRFHVEAIRAFWQCRGPDTKTLIEAIASAQKPTEPRRSRLSFALFLAQILDDYSSSDSPKWAAEMARAAEREPGTARWLAAAEAIDLVADRHGGVTLPLLSLLSQQFFVRAIQCATADTSMESAASRRMIRDHLPFMRGMHPRDWDWSLVDGALEALRKAEAGG